MNNIKEECKMTGPIWEGECNQRIIKTGRKVNVKGCLLDITTFLILTHAACFFLIA